ncbi:hypothetical protein [Helicobacter pylori]|uniref:hypothetical protein n=1 Tax=Helicobacter pylori TaxID=210 RepID=UPI00165AA359|nr:hypothetical protein [Helicobacter pylori]
MITLLLKALLKHLGVDYSNGDLAFIFGFDYERNRLNDFKEYETLGDILDLFEDIKLAFGVDVNYPTTKAIGLFLAS